MKTRAQIIAEINAQLADIFEIDESVITPEANIVEALELDSISLVDIVSIVHQDYGIMISKEDLSQIITFNNLYDYIETRQKA